MKILNCIFNIFFVMFLFPTVIFLKAKFSFNGLVLKLKLFIIEYFYNVGKKESVFKILELFFNRSFNSPQQIISEIKYCIDIKPKKYWHHIVIGWKWQNNENWKEQILQEYNNYYNKYFSYISSNLKRKIFNNFISFIKLLFILNCFIIFYFLYNMFQSIFLVILIYFIIESILAFFVFNYLNKIEWKNFK